MRYVLQQMMCPAHLRYQKFQIQNPQLYVLAVVRLFIQNVNFIIDS